MTEPQDSHLPENGTGGDEITYADESDWLDEAGGYEHLTDPATEAANDRAADGAETLEHLAHARYLGADAALCAASWLEMSEADARSILDGDGDPEVLDRYPEPTIGDWEEGCDETLREQLDADAYDETTGPDTLADAWEEGRDGCWSQAVEAYALRVVGAIPMAVAVEESNEAYVASLRAAAGLS